MSESVQTTLEEASRCPKCNEVGELLKKTPIASRSPNGARREVTIGAQLHHFMCMNTRCKWYNEVCRLVQVNPDGSIPPPQVKRIKEFPVVPDRTREVNDALERQLRLELEGGAEVSR